MVIKHIVLTVGVDVLTQERDLLESLGDKLLDLVHDAFDGTALLDASRSRDDAVRAALVAPVDDIHPRADVALPARLRRVFHDVTRLRGHDLIAVGDVLEQVGYPIGVLRSHDEVHLRHAT